MEQNIEVECNFAIKINGITKLIDFALISFRVKGIEFMYIFEICIQNGRNALSIVGAFICFLDALLYKNAAQEGNQIILEILWLAPSDATI